MRISRCGLVAGMHLWLARTALPKGVAGALAQGAGMRNVFGGRPLSAGAMCQRPQCAGGRTVSAAARLSCCKVSADKKCRQAQCIDRRAVSVCKLRRRSQGAGGLKAPGAAPCRRAQDVAGRKVSPGAMCRQGQCHGARNVLAGARFGRSHCVGARNAPAATRCLRAQCVGWRNVSAGVSGRCAQRAGGGTVSAGGKCQLTVWSAACFPHHNAHCAAPFSPTATSSIRTAHPQRRGPYMCHMTRPHGIAWLCPAHVLFAQQHTPRP